MNQVAMYLHVLPDLDVRLEVGGVDVPGGDGGPDERPYAVAHEDDAGDQAGPVWQPLQWKRKQRSCYFGRFFVLCCTSLR